jgi:hypothetical protein
MVNETEGIYTTYRRDEKCVKSLVGKPEGGDHVE